MKNKEVEILVDNIHIALLDIRYSINSLVKDLAKTASNINETVKRLKGEEHDKKDC